MFFAHGGKEEGIAVPVTSGARPAHHEQTCPVFYYAGDDLLHNYMAARAPHTLACAADTLIILLVNSGTAPQMALSLDSATHSPSCQTCFPVVLSTEAGETSQARICSMSWAAVLKDALYGATTDHPLLEKLVVVCQRLTTFAYEVDRGCGCGLPSICSPCSCPNRHSTSATYTGRRPGSLRKRGLRMFFGKSCKRVARRSAIF